MTTAGRVFGKGRRLATISAVAMSALLLVSCGDDEDEEPTTEATEVVTQATVPPVATDEPAEASPEASPMAATPAGGVNDDEATPADDASPAADEEDSSLVAGANDATPVAVDDEATPEVDEVASTPEVVAADSTPESDAPAIVDDGAATAETYIEDSATAVSDELDEVASPGASPDASPAS